jgi:hypothetical protein
MRTGCGLIQVAGKVARLQAQAGFRFMLSQFTLLLQQRDVADACKQASKSTQTKTQQSAQWPAQSAQASDNDGKGVQDVPQEEDEDDEAEGVWAEKQGKDVEKAPKAPKASQGASKGKVTEEQEQDAEWQKQENADEEENGNWEKEVYDEPNGRNGAKQRPGGNRGDDGEEEEEEEGEGEQEGDEDQDQGEGRDEGDQDEEENGDDGDEGDDDFQDGEEDAQGPDSWHPFFKPLRQGSFPSFRFPKMMMPFGHHGFGGGGGRRLLQQESQDMCLMGTDSWNHNSVDTTLPPGSYTLWIAKSEMVDQSASDSDSVSNLQNKPPCLICK